MSQILREVLGANSEYAASHGEKGKLPMPPARAFAILTCMDARMDPAKFAGLVEGDAHVLRNVGGRASDDAIRALVVSHALQGTREWFVVHHTDCGLRTMADHLMRDLFARDRPPGGPGSSDAEYFDWLMIRDPRESIGPDLRRIRSHPLVPAEIPIHGCVFDVRTGRLEVVESVGGG